MPRETVEQKADRLIADERYILVSDDRVIVSGSHGELYDVHKVMGQWKCPCPARTPRCAHTVVAHKTTTQVPEYGTPEYTEYEAELFRGL